MTHYNSFDITSVVTVSKCTESTRGLRDVMDTFGGKFSQRHLICMDVLFLAKNLPLQLEPSTDCCLIIIIISLLSVEVQLFLVFQFDILKLVLLNIAARRAQVLGGQGEREGCGNDKRGFSLPSHNSFRML